MSYSDDPYASPQADSALPKFQGSRNTIDVTEAFKFAFTNPNWFGNLFLVLVCMIIPIIGPIVFLGFQMELIELLLKQPNAACPQFDFSRFGDYLKRGVWPFVASLIAQLVLTPLMMIVIIPFVCIVPIVGAAMEDSAEGLAAICMLFSQLLMFVGIFVMQIVAMLVLTPMMIGAGLAGEVGPAIDFSFIKGFLSRTWKELCTAYLLFMLAALFLMPLGLCVFIIGAYLVAAWLWLAMSHIYYQAYALYLSRGGKPIEPKAEFAG